MQSVSRNFRLGVIVQLGFGVIFLLIIATAWIFKISQNILIESEEESIKLSRIETNLYELGKKIVDAETGERGFVITGNDEFLEPYYQAENAPALILDRLKEDTTDPDKLRRLDELESLVQRQMAIFAEVIDLKKTGQDEEAVALIRSGTGKENMEQIRALLNDMLLGGEQLLAERTEAANRAERLATIISIGGTAATIIFGSFIVYLVSKKIIQPIDRIAQDIASSSTEIAATTTQQERTASQQASSVNQTTTTMEELSASSRLSAEQAEAAAAGADRSLSLCEGGTHAVERTLAGMDILKDKVEAIAEQILHLSEQTGQIANISALVSDLANQTNMLALNAAVEAVRAGEHGKGFAVVASEIRKLADQSKKSAEKINALVSDIQTSINSTVMATDEGTKMVEHSVQATQETSAAFLGVTEAINNVVLNNQQISLTAKQQAIAVQQVVEAMNALNVAAQETASGIAQVKTGTQQLNEAAQNLQALV
jgi:methyl-accepting chemotaxis protein